MNIQGKKMVHGLACTSKIVIDFIIIIIIENDMLSGNVISFSMFQNIHGH